MKKNPYYYYPLEPKQKSSNITAEICIYQATPAGITAAIQAARLNRKVVIVEFGKRIGGMTASGLGATDIGNKHVIGGIAREFFRDIGFMYGTKEQWHFEPHVALAVFSSWIDKYKIPVFFEHRLSHVKKNSNRIESIFTEDGDSFSADVFIDASYEGDLMAKAGVSCTIGRESDSAYDEHYNGVHFGGTNHTFIRYVDPYKKPGDKSSGLLWGISDLSPGKQGEGDNIIQAYNFRLCLTDADDNRIPFIKPSGYDPEKYELLLRYINSGVFDLFGLNVSLPDKKTDHNNWGAVNSDFIGGSHHWPQSTYWEREKIYQEHVSYQQGLFWFCAHDERLPERVRKETNRWGLAADEFCESSGWPLQLYVREARRMIADYVITEHDAIGKFTARDSVGMASYKMDSHNCKRVVKSGRAMNEGDVEVAPLAPFPISYRAIRPKRSECTNLIVPVCISASHIGYGSVRMEPVFMILGQSAAAAASLAMKKDNIVQDISYSDLESLLISQKQVLSESSEHIRKEGISERLKLK